MFLRSYSAGLSLFRLLILVSASLVCMPNQAEISPVDSQKTPNFILIMTDDQSWEHTSFEGYPKVSTPNFDDIASRGVYFSNAYVSAPTCTASRSSILAGQHFWRLGTASVLWGRYPDNMPNFMRQLISAGYDVGYTGKGWGPGKVPEGFAPMGKGFYGNERIVENGYSRFDYAQNLSDFLDSAAGNSFAFWIGIQEPHRPFSKSVRNRFENDLAGFPPFVPPLPGRQATFSAYLDEIEFFDRDLGRIMEQLSRRGLLENTVVIITSDNGMPFIRGKGSVYQHGTKVPLVVHWPQSPKSGMHVATPVSLIDLAPTILSLAGVSASTGFDGEDLSGFLLEEDKNLPADRKVFAGYERHVYPSRKNHETYPTRAVMTKDFLFINNFKPDRWPLGDPPGFKDVPGHKGEVIDALVFDKKYGPLIKKILQKRPAEELYDLVNDPYQLKNLAGEKDYEHVQNNLKRALHAEMERTSDPILTGEEESFSEFKCWAVNC